jgi:hypothetical protein
MPAQACAYRIGDDNIADLYLLTDITDSNFAVNKIRGSKPARTYIKFL